jgi:Peptidase propeptide and YPEB domain
MVPKFTACSREKGQDSPMSRARLTVSGGLALALGFALLAPVPAGAHGARAHDRVPRNDQDAARDGVRAGHLIPLSEILPRIAARFGGRMLDADLHEIVPGEPVYRVLWLTPDNRKLEIWVDARTGQIIRVEG